MPNWWSESCFDVQNGRCFLCCWIHGCIALFHNINPTVYQSKSEDIYPYQHGLGKGSWSSTELSNVAEVENTIFHTEFFWICVCLLSCHLKQTSRPSQDTYNAIWKRMKKRRHWVAPYSRCGFKVWKRLDESSHQCPGKFLLGWMVALLSTQALLMNI